MADLLIQDERIAWRLLDIARRENRSVEALLDTLLSQYDTSDEGEKSSPGTFAALADAARRANIRSSEPVDTSERSREILNRGLTNENSIHDEHSK
jgi:hypothetical protein